jgi:hypothetical protein
MAEMIRPSILATLRAMVLRTHGRGGSTREILISFRPSVIHRLTPLPVHNPLDTLHTRGPGQPWAEETMQDRRCVPSAHQGCP